MTKQNPTFKISVAKDFSPYPAGRYIADSNLSGQVFRENLLAPTLKNDGNVLVDLDGTEGYGSSFLEEAFGGLIREEGFDLPDLMQRLTFKSNEDPSLIEEIIGYLKDAATDKNP